ncbi:MAG: PH domain-containing protein [Massiliimalia sp.]|jgi:uncharacterized membrane protein YdbT with pleckstrin-like domain
MKPRQVIWKDRKRILGMPLSFTKYSMTDDRLFWETGLLNSKEEEIILYRVRDITLTRSLGQKIFGVGSVTVYSSDKTSPQLELKNIKNPREVKELLYQQVEQIKIDRKMRFGELLDNDWEENDMEESDHS